MLKTPEHKMMTPEQKAYLLRMINLGMDWVSGKIDFEAVKQILGKPELDWVDNEIGYAYFPGDMMTVDFYFDKDRLGADEKPAVKSFWIQVGDYIDTDIPMADYEQRLGLHRLVYGEQLDEVRVEDRYFFRPAYRDPGGDPKEVSLSYRVPMPADTLYDVYPDFEYRTNGLGGKDDPELLDPKNLRRITISRRYLTKEEIAARNAARAARYKAMDLRSGMVCPETAIWQGRHDYGKCTELVVRKGEMFPPAYYLPPGRITANAPLKPAAWVWLRRYPES